MQRMTVQEAAQVLGITENGVRQRIRRGHLESEKEGDGRVYVWLNLEDSTPAQVDHERVVDVQLSHIESLKQQIEFQQRELERKDHLLASLMQRVPELMPAEEPDERSWWRKFFGL